MDWAFRLFMQWIPLCVVTTLICGLMYTIVQQNYRQSLNDPQIQMAEDAAASLSAGRSAGQVVPIEKVPIAISLSPWIAVYDSDRAAVASSGIYNGAPPQIPQGAFDAAQRGEGKDTALPNENRITWQPQAGVRQAIVIVYFNSSGGSGYVVAGRNMREIEGRISSLSEMIAFGWIASILAALFVIILVDLGLERSAVREHF